MNFQYFGIDSIPDLALSKYSFFDEGGVDGVLKKTGAFLRQIHRKGLLSKVFWHLLYVYDPNAPAGHRMKVYFIASGQETNSLLYTQELVQKSALSSFYNFQDFGVEPNILLPPNRQVFPHVAVLVKRVFSVEPSVVRPEDQDVKFHRVAEWKMNESARLCNLFQLMRGLNQPAAFRVDIFPVDYAAGLRNVLPIQELRKRTSMRSSMDGSGISFQRDENAEETLRQYENVIKKYESSPHFRANILAFANEEGIATLLVDAAGAEALESGNYQIESLNTTTNNQKYNLLEYIIDSTAEGGWLEKLELGNLAFLPSLFLLEELRPFFCFPALYDGETLEIPKETAPKLDEKGLDLGIDENQHQVSIETKLFKKHVFIAGVPGSGKTNTMLHLATTFWKKYEVPFLILEPAKKEYRALARIAGMEDLLLFSPSSASMFPLHINPFEFPAGMQLAEHIRNLMAVFEGAFQLVGPTPFLIDSAIEAVYRKKGWRPNTKNDLTRPYPTLSEFYERISVEVDAAGYEGETRSNVKSFVQVRLGSLLRREMGDLFDVSSSTLKPEEWLTKPALIELEAMGSGPANFLTLLLCTLIREALKIAPRDDQKYKEKPRHVIFLEEAHNLIGPEANEVTGENADPKLAATAYIVKMLAEVRALHESIIIADQLPSKMAPEVIKNTGLKMTHRLTADDDRNLLGRTMSASATQLEQLATYEVGDALVATEKLLRPYKVKICKWQEDENKYEPPTDEQLFSILADLKNLEPPKNQGYDDQLKRSMEICHAKCWIEYDRLLGEIDQVIWTYRDEMPGLEVLLKESGDKRLLARLTTEKETLNKRLTDLLSSMSALHYKAKEYFQQNPIYKRKLFDLLLNLREAWIHIYVCAKTWHPKSAVQYRGDNEEIVNFEV